MFGFLNGRLLLVRVILLAAVFGLIGIGVLSIYSVGHPAEETAANNAASIAELSTLWKKQVVFIGVGILGFAAMNVVNYRKLGQMSYWLYGGILLLLLVLLAGRYLVKLPFIPEINGTHRWIQIHPKVPRIQPSEFCKLAYIIALAWYLRYRSNYRRFQALIGPFALTLLPMVLILPEPDLGTVMLMMPVLFVMVFVAGARVKHLLLIILLAAAVSPVMWHLMENYQRSRISSVLLQYQWVQNAAVKHPVFSRILIKKKFDEKEWKNGDGYHLVRSKCAIASGGASGQGFRHGDFVKYDFLLPERQNDFVFAIIAHEWGLWGCLGILGLYAVIIWCGLEITAHNSDPFGRLLVIGILAMFAVEVIENVSMTVGLMPITGLTLPFVSYGGSSLLVSLLAVGLLNNVGRRRPFSVSRKTPMEM